MQRKELLFWINLWRWASTSRALYTVLSIDIGSHEGVDMEKFWLEIVLYLFKYGATACMYCGHMC